MARACCQKLAKRMSAPHKPRLCMCVCCVHAVLSCRRGSTDDGPKGVARTLILAGRVCTLLLSCIRLNRQPQTHGVDHESGASAPILRAALRWCAVGAYASCHVMCACVRVGG